MTVETKAYGADLAELVGRLGEPEVLVLGDLMLDRYIWGDAERISQEAPVMLLRADRREERLGGASSVSMMLAKLGARVRLAGVVGADEDARRVRGLLDSLGVDHAAVLEDSTRPTTVKERYIGRAQQKHPQQMIRVDYETRTPLEAGVEKRLSSALEAALEKIDIVLVSDYDKGVCTPALLARLTQHCRARGIRILADPIRGRDYRKYHGMSAMTPNRLEAGLATGRTLDSVAEAHAAAIQLRDTLDLEAGIITLDSEGMALAPHSGDCLLFPVRPRQVYDITGAGDMVLAVLGLALAAGADYPRAIRLANVAGGLEVEKIGVAPVSRQEILQDLARAHVGGRPAKLVSLGELLAHLETRRTGGARVSFTNGCFDLLHAGHVQYLAEARAQGDLLVVGLNSDASVSRLKGPSRPVNPQEARGAVLAGLEAVDFVVVFDEPTPLELVRAVRPQVLVKGADYRRETVVGADLVESWGGRVHLAELKAGYSSTRLITRMEAA